MATYHLRLKNDTKPNGIKVSAKGHADYILRANDEKQTDLNYKGSQLPSWADGSAQNFFEAATRYEDKGNRRFKEIEMSLPNELTLEQNLEIVNAFIAKHLSNHYYAFAIHEKTGALSGVKHPHVHIMFSERLIDDVEKINERPASKYFKRAAKPLKGENVASFERRREHGAPKDKKWHDRNFLFQIRADFATIQNEVLKKYGKTIRVDYRTLDAQQQEAEKNGDTFLAKLNLRVPEKYIGVQKSHSDNPFVLTLQKRREKNSKKLVSLFNEDIAQIARKEYAVREMVKQAELTACRLSSFTADIANLNGLKRKLQTTQENIEKAQAEYLSPSEFKTLQIFKESLRRIYHLEKLKEAMKRPSDSQFKNLESYNEIIGAINNRIATLRKYLPLSEVEKIEEKIKNPSTYKNIALISHQHFQASLAILEEMKKQSEDILSKCCTLAENAKPLMQDIFSIADLTDNLRLQHRSLKSQQETSESALEKLRKKVIRPSRALLIAKNIFLKGSFKKLNAEKSKYNKAIKKFDSDFNFYKEQKILFDNTHWENQADKIQQFYLLMKTNFTLKRRQEELKQWNTKLENESQRLENLCSSDEAKQEIGIIAASILRKNLPIVQAFEKEKKKLAAISLNLKLTQKRLNFISKYPTKKNYFYRVIPSADLPRKKFENKNFIVALIADALSGENYAVPLVARSYGNNLEMEKNWELMSDIERDDLLSKKIVRNL